MEGDEMHYGKIGALTLPVTGIVISHSILMAMTLITVGVVFWQLVPRIRRNRAQR